MMRHYPDLSSSSDWMKQIFNQSEALLGSQTRFRGETSGGVAKCRLFSRAIGKVEL